MVTHWQVVHLQLPKQSCIQRCTAMAAVFGCCKQLGVCVLPHVLTNMQLSTDLTPIIRIAQPVCIIQAACHDFCQVSPLHLAVVLGYADMAVQLLEAGADPNLQNRLGMTPLQLAVARDRQVRLSNGAICAQ